MYQFTIGLRSLLYRKSQYVSLFLVCMFGVAVSFASLCISNGMMKSLVGKAKIYYGGDFVLMCSTEAEGLEIWDYKVPLERVRGLLPDDAVVSARMDFDARHSSFYFEGVQALQQTIKGVDFETEAALLDRFNFSAGGIDGMNGSNGVLVSEPIARILNVQVGDEITFQLETRDGYQNTVPVVVRGIFQDSSVFGMYTSYMDFDFLKRAYGRPENFANRICVYFPKRTVSDADLHRFYDVLSAQFNMYRYVTDKDDYIDDDDSFAVPTWGFIPLGANLTDVQIMELAMDAIITFIVSMLTVIIIAGIGSTYRVLVMKRINEIGIYMAIGMKKRAIVATMMCEAFALLVAGCVAGIALCSVFCAAVSGIDFSFIPSFNLFLERGNLAPELDVIKGVIVIVSVIFITLLAVLYSTYKSIKIMPAEALATTE